LIVQSAVKNKLFAVLLCQQRRIKKQKAGG
jgi:hypothetical protein